MNEEWKDIEGFEGLYKISNFGRVYSIRSKKTIKPFTSKGYLRICLSKNGVQVKKLIHVLVAEHFISKKPFDNAQINHKDLNKLNNKVSNLEWVSPSQNVRHLIENSNDRKKYLQKRMSEIGKNFGLLGVEASKKPVAQIDVETNKIIKIFESARDAYRKTGVNYKKISEVCRGQRKTAGGFKWVFYSEGVTTIETTA